MIRIIDINETKSWLRFKGLAIDSKGAPTFQACKEIATYSIPHDSGRKTALAREIASWFEKDIEALLWINEFGIWPSSEDLNLFIGFRKSLGEKSSLNEKPGHLFSQDDLEIVASLLSMVFYFCWGAFLIPASKEFIFKISHDEMINIFAVNKTSIKKQLSNIERIIKAI